ncbi:SDR family NAD(P)-dependent oxidoreductase [Paenibacillus allorhizosphaerae]|uniref:Benzil reductase ((S)-benzoin forming) n=1 Tax=Paenibacillus allorhizosphaerae TaxID=2849866 RepID=A0ABN7TUH6_9BACL|nr:SDR family NAD(P)-dependent oxidoreductase [Paenibacillus allorhizosphaerae]CAG7650035.1 Benzil reductase ((S)-benzoin forming) [Paenibacillus allorhizosphaerae]
MHYYIITGASSGLGIETARLLLRPDQHVVSISRTSPISLVRQAEQTGGLFTHIGQDLSKTDELPGCIDRLMEVIAKSSVQPTSVCLIHNAANAAPFKHLDRHTLDEISASLNLNLLSPVLFSSLWIKRVQPLHVPKKLIFISSGSAEYPMAGMSLYCSAKAGLNMLVRCLHMEQRGLPYGVQVAAVDPGMMDTPMQTAAREAREEQFPSSAFFRQSRDNGLLRTPESVAHLLVQWMSDPASWSEGKRDTIHKL